MPNDCFAKADETNRERLRDWFVPTLVPQHWESNDAAGFSRLLEEMWEMPGAGVADRDVVFLNVDEHEGIQDRFNRFANEWSADMANVSSLTVLVKHPRYQDIIDLGWEVVPLLLRDLQEQHRFWFPALRAITKVQPFDSSDTGNIRRMTKAWLEWGKRKQLI